MDVSGFVWVVTAAIFISLIVLAGVCLSCRNKGPLVSIRQGDATEEYMQSTGFRPTGFRPIHPYQQTSEMNPIHPSSLSPFSLSSPVVGIGHQRHPSFTPTENESNPSYENPPDGSDRQDHESVSNSSYIEVLADLPEVKVPSTSPSRASTSSSDSEGKYVNVSPIDEEGKYVNVPPIKSSYLNEEPIHSLTGAAEAKRESERESDSDSDDEGNYVNQPASHYNNLSDV